MHQVSHRGAGGVAAVLRGLVVPGIRVGVRAGAGGDRVASAGHGSPRSAEKRTWRRRIPNERVWHVDALVEFTVTAGSRSGEVEGAVHFVVNREAARMLGLPDDLLDAAVAGNLALTPQGRKEGRKEGSTPSVRR